MLKVTVRGGPRAITITLEGRIIGPWVEELRRTWEELDPSSESKRCCVDLRGVTFVDAAGQALLQEMYRVGADFLSNSVMTRHLIEEIQRKSGPRKRP